MSFPLAALYVHTSTSDITLMSRDLMALPANTEGSATSLNSRTPPRKISVEILKSYLKS